MHPLLIKLLFIPSVNKGWVPCGVQAGAKQSVCTFSQEFLPDYSIKFDNCVQAAFWDIILLYLSIYNRNKKRTDP